MVNEWLEHEIYQGTPVKDKIFDQLFQQHWWQLLHQVGTEAISPRTILAMNLAQITTAAKIEVYGVAIMTPNKEVQFQMCLSEAETITTTTSIIADTDGIVKPP